MAYPHSVPRKLLTVAEYLELGEDEDNARLELTEGNLVVSPSPRPRHSRAAFQISRQLEPQLPAQLDVLLDTDVDLQLAPPDEPGTVRRPDVLVVECAEFDHAEETGGILRASGVWLAVEIVSRGSNRTDRVTKRAEYADAGIQHYWIVDLNDPVSLLACHLAGALGYLDGGEHTGVFTTTVPFPMTVDLGWLTRKV